MAEDREGRHTRAASTHQSRNAGHHVFRGKLTAVTECPAKLGVLGRPHTAGSRNNCTMPLAGEGKLRGDCKATMPMRIQRHKCMLPKIPESSFADGCHVAKPIKFGKGLGRGEGQWLPPNQRMKNDKIVKIIIIKKY